MIINLLDIGEEGHEFSYTMGDEAPVDKLIAETLDNVNDYAFKVNIMKTGDIYTANGRFTLEKDDVCSKCGHDIHTPINQKFTEFLMNESHPDQKGHAPHSGLNIENQQEVTFVTGHQLDLGDFMREQFAVAIPSYPACADKVACGERQKEYEKYFVKEEKVQGHPAFAVLSDLKKKH